MFEKILQKLKEQRGNTSNVSDRTLEDMSRSYESFITTDEQLESADFTGAIKSVDGNIKHISAEAVKSVQKKKPVTTTPASEGSPDDPKGDPVSTSKDPVVQALLEQNKQIQASLGALLNDKTKTSRKESLMKALEGTPEYYTKPIMSSFEGSTFENEEAFDTFINSTKEGATSFKESAQKQGLNTFTPSSDIKVPEDTGETESLASAREIIQKEKEKKNN